MIQDAEEAECVQQAVVEFGHSTVRIHSESDLRSALRMESVTAAVLDFSMIPTATSSIRTCLTLRPGMPFLAIVCDEQREIAVEALRLGAHACLRRPLHPEEVIFSVGNLLASVAERYDATHSLRDTRRVEIPNDFDLVTPLAKSLVDVTISPVDPRRNHVILGLVELLNNAIEHGNLEIDYQEKHQALSGSYFYRLAIDKAKTEPWVSRKVSIECGIDSQTGWITYRICDEGKGFDWRNMPDPLDSEGIQARHGRGVLMARHSFDELEYNEKGNEVTVRLRIRPTGGQA
jgi:anti-sigma regulatory factor (Ser/Thr protein kinase)